jgi:hypothetical protein
MSRTSAKIKEGETAVAASHAGEAVELEVRQRSRFDLDAHMSTTVQSVLSLDREARTYSALLELDFKYNVADFLKVFGESFPETAAAISKPDGTICASELRMPWIITNAIEISEHGVTNFSAKET